MTHLWASSRDTLADRQCRLRPLHRRRASRRRLAGCRHCPESPRRSLRHWPRIPPMRRLWRADRTGRTARRPRQVRSSTGSCSSRCPCTCCGRERRDGHSISPENMCVIPALLTSNSWLLPTPTPFRQSHANEPLCALTICMPPSAVASNCPLIPNTPTHSRAHCSHSTVD